MIEITTLTRRELTANPTTLTSNEFVDMIMQDIENAKKTYFDITTRKADARHERSKQEYLKRREEKIAAIIKQSYEKYTREYYRKRWVEKELAKWPEEYERSCWDKGEELTYVDWSMEPWKNGTYSVSLNRRTNEEVREFFADMFKNDLDNKYFSQCMGWEIVVNQRPYFRLILSPELQAEWDADEKRLYNEITRFYSSSTYCGD
jgi:hypothetical protein